MQKEVASGLPPDERVFGTDEVDTKFRQISQSIQNKEWKQECLKRDEKFDMNFTSAVRGYKVFLASDPDRKTEPYSYCFAKRGKQSEIRNCDPRRGPQVD